MSLKALIEKMDELNSSAVSEATKTTATGRIHKAEPGGYGRKDDEDSEGKKVEPTVKRGRGRPPKTGEHTQNPEEKEKQAKREKAGKELQSFMVGNLPGGKAPGKKGQVHKIKDESIEESTSVTDYAPKSQGGTRKELIAKYKKTKNPKDAEAARKAGATQKELQGVTESEQDVEESGLQAYLGNKKYGKEGMNALRKAGQEGAGKEEMAKIRARYDKLDEEDMMEAMDPEKRARLDDLIDQFRDATDPSDYASYNDPDDAIAAIRSEFGDKIADQVASGAEKMHFGRGDIHQRSDPLAWKTYRGKNRVTKGGKLFKQDSDYLKNTIKSRYKLSGKSATEGVLEDTKETSTGRIHKAGPGGYGRKDDEDSDGKKVQPQVKRGRGRPKKNADSDTGEVKKWDTDKLSSWIIGNKPKTLPGKTGVKHKLKDWMEHVEREMIVESMVHEGRMADVDLLMQELAAGNADIYDVMNNPTTPEERYASKILQGMYDDVVIDSGLHPDDDFEEIIDMMGDRLANEYGKELDEVALDQSQVAAPQIKASGAAAAPTSQTSQPAQTSSSTQQPSTGSTQPGTGMAVIDFKNPNDPLKSAVQQAVKNKQVAVMATESKQTNEGTRERAEKLERILRNYPMEHRMAQEGWGMHESLYQALCDHYWDEGRIPREKMYGEGQGLRDWVEECYMEDLQPVMENPVLAAAARGMAAGVGAAAADKLLDSDYSMEEEMGDDLGVMEQNMSESKLNEKAKSKAQQKFMGMVHAAQKGEKPASKAVGDVAKSMKKGDVKDFAKTKHKGLPEKVKKTDESVEQGVAEGTNNIDALIQKLEDMQEMIYQMQPGFKQRQLLHRRDNLEAKIEAMPGGKEALRHWAEEYEKSFKMESKLGEQGVAEGQLNELSPELLARYRQAKGAERDLNWKWDPEKEKQRQAHNEPITKNVNRALYKELEARRKQSGVDDNYRPNQGVAEEKDVQMESWENQLSTLLNEGMTITTSTGNENSSDSVSISATDADAQTLMKMLQNSGLMRGQSSSMSTEPQGDDHASVTVEPVSADEVMGTLEPGDDDGGEEAMGFLKRMLGARGDHASSGDYAQEGTESNEVEESDNYEATQHSQGDSQMSPIPEDEMEERNLFTGNLAKARAAGKKEADLDGDGDMEKVKEELKGGQKELDVAPPKGKLTADDFKKLRTQRGDKVEEESLDQPATMEADDWSDAGSQDLAASVAQNANSREDAETEKETAMSEEEETCNECGMYESKCDCKHEEKLDEWANSPNGSSKDESFLTDLQFITKSISGGLNNMKQDQTVLPSTRVKTDTERMDSATSMAEMIRKLSNIN